MSKSIDKRVVEMEFDNSKFEQNVQTSMKTLDNLNNSLERLPETSGKGLSLLSKVASNIDLSGVSDAIDIINHRFSTMGIVGQEVIRNLTNTAIHMVGQVYNSTIGQIKSGGLSRAKNIEQAKFMLEGMGVAWKDLEKDISYAVDGTAYGLDAAANAAAQFTASGVKAGEQMKASLRGISGVAAMTNSSYEEIAHVFTSVAGQGRLMAMNLESLSIRGINAAAILGEQLGKTETEIRELVSKGKIDFDTFAKAMDNAFGEHAKDADRTFFGVTSNIKSALSKIGALFYQPLIANDSNLVQMLASLKVKLNELRTYIEPAINVVTNNILKLSSVGKEWIDSWNFTPIQLFMTQMTNALRNLITATTTLKSKVEPLGTALKDSFKDVFPKRFNLGAQIVNVSDSLKKFANRLQFSEETLDNVKTISKGLFSTLSLGIKILQTISDKLSPMKGKLSELGSKLLDITLSVSKFMIELNETYDMSDPFKSVRLSVEKLRDALSNSRITNVIKEIVSYVKYLLNGIKVSFNYETNAITGTISAFITVLQYLINSLVTSFGKLTGINVSKISLQIYFALEKAKDKIREFINSIGDFKDKYVNFLKTVIDYAKQAATPLTNAIKSVKEMFNTDNLIDPKMTIGMSAISVVVMNLILRLRLLKKQADNAKTIFDTGGLFGKFKDKGIIGTLSDTVKALKSGMKAITGAPKKFSAVMTEVKRTLKSFETEINAKAVKQIAISIAILAGSLALISMIKTEKLLSAAGALTGIIAAVAGLMAEITALSKNEKTSSKSMQSIGISMIEVAAAIAVLAGALKAIDSLENPVDSLLMMISMMLSLIAVLEAVKLLDIKSINKVAISMILVAEAVKILAKGLAALNGMDSETIRYGAGAILGLMTGLTIMAKIISSMDLSGFTKTATGMLVLAAGIGILTLSIKALGEMDMNQLLQGMLALTFALIELGLLAAAMNKVDGFKETAVGLLLVAVAIRLVASAFETLGNMNPESVIMAFIALAGSMMGLVAILYTMQDSLLQAGAGLILVAVAMRVMVGAIESLGNMDITVLFTGILGLGTALIVLSAGCKSMEGSISGAFAMMIVAGGLAILAPAIATIGNLSLGEIAKALTTIAIAIIGLSVAAIAMEGALPGAAAMLVMSVSLMALAVALGLMAALPIEGVAKALIVFAAGILAFAGLSALLSPLLAPMAALAGIVAILAASMLIFGAAMAVFALALDLLSVSGAAGAVGLGTFCAVLAQYTDIMAAGAAVILVLAAALIVLDASLLVAATSITLISVAITALAISLMLLAGSIVVASAAFLAVKKMLASTIEEIKELLGEDKWKEIAGNAVEGLINGLKDGVKGVVGAAVDLGKGILNGIKEFLGIHSPSTVMQNEIGANIVMGIVKGIKDKLNKAVEAAKEVGSKILSKIKSVLKIHSPSRVMEDEVGKNVVAGVAKGIKKNTNLVSDASEDLGKETINSMSGALKQVNDALNGDLDTPTITPVLDLSNVQNGVNSIDSMLNRNQAANISANITASRKSQEQIDQYNSSQLQKLSDKLDAVVAASNNETNVDVNVVLEGDANGVFRLVRQQNNTHKKMTGKSAFA